jgi:hypothetical protein
MHQIYSTLAADIARDRIREADMARLADHARRNGARNGRRVRARTAAAAAGRLRDRIAELLRQPALRPTFNGDPSDCA